MNEITRIGTDLHALVADEALLDLPISSKFNGEADFLSELFEAGRRAAADPTTHRRVDRSAPTSPRRGG